MICNILLYLLSVPLICCVPFGKSKPNTLKLDYSSLGKRFDPLKFKKDLFFSEEDKKEFVQSTLTASEAGFIELTQDKSKVTFEDAWNCFAKEIDPLRVEFHRIPASNPRQTVNSHSFDTLDLYLDSIFDRGAVFDFQEGLIDLANAMQRVVQDSKEITQKNKQEFALKVKKFLARIPQRDPKPKRRFYLNPQNLSVILSERKKKNISNSSSSLQWSLEEARPTYLTDNLIAADMLEEKITLKFWVLFDPRVQIPNNYGNLFSANLPGFKDDSSEALLAWLINQMLGIVDYCESNGTVFDPAKLQDWKSEFPKDFKPKPVNFRNSNRLGRIIVAFVVFALLCTAAVTGIFIYKRKKEQALNR